MQSQSQSELAKAITIDPSNNENNSPNNESQGIGMMSGLINRFK